MTGWIRLQIRLYRQVAAVALGVALLLLGMGLGIWLDWDWKALIGWKALVHYIHPGDATERKEALQVYAIIVAGVAGTPP